MRTVWKKVTSREQLQELIQYCKDTRTASVDFETNAEDPASPDLKITGLGVSFQVGSGWFIPLQHSESPFEHTSKSLLHEFCTQVIENPAITKYVFNGLFEYRIFLRLGYRPYGRFLDVMMMKYLLNEERPNDLKSLVDMYLPDFAGYDLENKPGKKAKHSTKVAFWSNVPIEKLGKYCSGDCEFTLRLGYHFENRLMDVGLYHLFRNFYSPLIRILSQTILKGVLVDRPYLKGLVKRFRDKLDDCLADLYKIPEIAHFNDEYKEAKLEKYIEKLQEAIDSGELTDRQINTKEEKISSLEAGEPTTKKEIILFEDLNFNSNPQLIQLLYESDEGFEFPVLGYTDKKNPSTGEDILLKLLGEDTSGFIKGLLKYRGLVKLYSTYIYNMYNDHLTDEDKIHPSYLLHGTVSGRFSSRNPNFQNIPREATSIDIKRMFIAPKDYFFVEIDGSQMELRVAAEMSKDIAMIEIFNQGKNIHVATAAVMFDIEYDLINKARKNADHPQHLEMVKKHKSAKVLNFTIFYGAGPKKVAEFLTERTGEYHSKEDAREFMDKWFEAFPQASAWIKRVQKKARRNGYALGIFGRKRRLSILNDPNNQRIHMGSWNEALRQAVNAPIQGSASDITQWVNIIIYEASLRGEFPPYLRVVSTVHDSIEYYVHKDDIHSFMDRALSLAKELPEMKELLGYTFKHVDMKFSGEAGIRWGTKEGYDPKIDYSKKYREEIRNIRKNWDFEFTPYKELPLAS